MAFELIDTHCHLDLEAFADDRSAVLERARHAGVTAMLIIGFDPDCWDRTLTCVAHDPATLAASLGVHPTEADKYHDGTEALLRQRAQDPRVAAIGEIGIDLYRHTTPLAQQREAFYRQIMLAKELGLPFIVHQRQAEAETLDVLRQADPPHHGVMHCFTGDIAYARACLDLGLFLGIGGVVTFRSARAVQEVVRWAPLDRLVLETDAPFLAPSPHRGQRNEPAYVRIIAEQVAALRGQSLELIAATTTANARALFPRAWIQTTEDVDDDTMPARSCNT